MISKREHTMMAMAVAVAVAVAKKWCVTVECPTNSRAPTFDSSRWMSTSSSLSSSRFTSVSSLPAGRRGAGSTQRVQHTV
jgi:hypothetical protein